MSFDPAKASPEQIQARLEKFKRKAPQIIDQAHFDLILDSFPDDQREAVFQEIAPLLPFIPNHG